MTVEVYRVLTPYNNQLCGIFANMFKAMQYTRSRPDASFIYQSAAAETTEDAVPDSVRRGLSGAGG